MAQERDKTTWEIDGDSNYRAKHISRRHRKKKKNTPAKSSVRAAIELWIIASCISVIPFVLTSITKGIITRSWRDGFFYFLNNPDLIYFFISMFVSAICIYGDININISAKFLCAIVLYVIVSVLPLGYVQYSKLIGSLTALPVCIISSITFPFTIVLCIHLLKQLTNN